jgi:N-acetyl-anhydromuramyl-L-alanine amidase AmpD
VRVVDRLTRVNYWPGRAGRAVEAVCLHITDGETAAGALSWFADPESGVSAHYVVDRDGAIYRALPEGDTAWANGGLKQPNLTNPLIAGWARAGLNPNRVTLSVEAVGRPGNPWPAAQRRAVAWLIGDLCRRHGLPIDRTRVIAHAELNSVTRARCPGLTAGQWAALLAEASAGQGGATDPTGGHAVGEGIRAALAAAADTALGPERYVKANDAVGELSYCAGRRGLWLWTSDGGQVYFLPRAAGS